MTNVVLLGGNGYIGCNVTEEWLKKDPSAVFYVVSRSGKNQLNHSRVYNLAADVADYQAVAAVLPDKVDYIVDFVGRPENDAIAFEQVNDKPAQVMLQIAKDKKVKAMGFIGGLLGPKSFLDGKKRIADQLRASGIRTEVVESTVVYGNGRSDALAKLVPVFKFFGLFVKNMKPVLVSDVASELVSKMVK
ncbi:TPA: NAD-dependent epimerase/dehydratase family protein [Streptococcus suis]